MSRAVLGLGTVLSVMTVLSGCQLVPSATWQTVQASVSQIGKSPEPPVLRPEFEYLQVSSRGQSNYLALGYRQRPAGAAGSAHVLEHWYSAHGELLVLDDGRLLEAYGLPVEWRGQRAPATPSWDTVAAANGAIAWSRIRDEMPAYRLGVRDEISSQRVAAPPEDAPVLPSANAVTWVQEQVSTTLADGRAWSYSQWFALAKTGATWSVLWSRQCLAPEWCLEMSPVHAQGRP